VVVELQQLLATLILIGTFILLITEKLPRTYAALVGAGLAIVLGVLPSGEALSAINIEVLSTIIGLMVMTEALSRTGLFDSLATFLVISSKGSSRLLHSLLVVTIYILSMIISNIAAILIVIPITIRAMRKLGIDPKMTLMTEAIAVNIGGIGLPISSIPNVMVCIESGLGMSDFLTRITPASILLLMVCLLISLKNIPKVTKPIEGGLRVDMGGLSLSSFRYIAAFIVSLILIIAYDMFGMTLPVAALIAGSIALLVSKESPEVLKEIDWPTIFFLSGIFVVIRGAERTGLLTSLSDAFSTTVGGNSQLAMPLILWVSATTSAAIDNIPITATLIPVINGLKGIGSVRWWALILGANLGGNFTAIGSPSNIILLGLSRRYGVVVSFKEFSRYGTIHTTVYLILCTLYLYVMYWF